MILVLVVRSSEPVLHNCLCLSVFALSLGCLESMKCWIPQHIPNVSKDKCEVLTLHLPSVTFKSLQLGMLHEIWESFWTGKQERNPGTCSVLFAPIRNYLQHWVSSIPPG